MYIKVLPHDNEESHNPQVRANIQLKCADPTKTTPNSTKSAKGSQHHCPPYDSGCPQTQNQGGKEKKK